MLIQNQQEIHPIKIMVSLQ